LQKLSEQKKQPEIYVYSLKITPEEAKIILQKYSFVKIIIRTDIEYFFYEYFENKTALNNIPNIVYSSQGNIVQTEKEKLTYDLKNYII
jgi:hypothetical protein